MHILTVNIHIYIFAIVYICIVCLLCHVWLFVTLWTIAPQYSLSMEFSKQEYWNGLPFSTLGHLPNPGIKLTSLEAPTLASGFFTTGPPGKSILITYIYHLQYVYTDIYIVNDIYLCVYTDLILFIYTFRVRYN